MDPSVNSATGRHIPIDEIRAVFSRSSGPGGQYVNKASTKVMLYWNVGKSVIFTEEEKEKIRKKLSKKMNNDDDLMVISEESRSQLDNRHSAIHKLEGMIYKALEPDKVRKAFRVTRASKLRSIEYKRNRSRLKGNRKVLPGDYQ
jgi:ribosome-associated protein